MNRLAKHSGELAVSAVSVGEIVFGARRLPGGERYFDYLTGVVLPHISVLPVDVVVALRYGELRAALESRGRPRADLDLLIGATALAHGLTLVTGNHRHFAGMPDLVVVDWFGRA
jgi:predicted nucleic acid-binding protein